MGPIFRFPVHEVPSSNQFDSALRMQKTPINKESEEQKEVAQHLRARVQPMPQADAKDAQYRFGFGMLMFLMVSVGLGGIDWHCSVSTVFSSRAASIGVGDPGSVASD